MMTRNQRKQKLLWKQRIVGIVFILAAVAILLLCRNTGEDCGSVFICAPLGATLLASKELLIF